MNVVDRQTDGQPEMPSPTLSNDQGINIPIVWNYHMKSLEILYYTKAANKTMTLSRDKFLLTFE